VKRLIAATVLAAALLGQAATAHAYCTSHTIWVGNRVTICTTCCYYGMCNTTCY
jgi:hypothetical protein